MKELPPDQQRALRKVLRSNGLILPQANTEIAIELGAMVDEKLPPGYSYALVIIPHDSKQQVQLSYSQKLKPGGLAKILRQVISYLK